MGFYRFSEEEVQDIKLRLDDIALTLKQKQRTEPDQIWYDNQEFLQIMNISKRTAAYWRTENVITYSQVGNKIYYRLSDIMDLLQKSTIPANSINNLKISTDGDNNDL
ncbi:hypothetical protein BZG02_07005 [Labilibaculum filiforme]|uniref:Uncharacterized protein n=1 Tax=Labilibaculum filiforme TaxID=1940526 RepID=A0A2N3I0C1_9BACT|nr:helix-turn-helix domain-containing protein [Labilibaculum filiforme]PKQ63770.1 hypothetical protein BZG02_07005 [Labilibaculum filiforme]